MTFIAIILRLHHVQFKFYDQFTEHYINYDNSKIKVKLCRRFTRVNHEIIHLAMKSTCTSTSYV